MDWKEKIKEALHTPLSKLNITLTLEQEEKIFQYYDQLVQQNKVMNLTAITDEVEFVQKHIIDSIASAQFVDYTKINTIIDVGTGAGLPGIPLKILFPHLKITLMDSLNKRIVFLEALAKELHMEDITIIHSRAEELGQDNEHREAYDCCVSRAVSQLNILSEYCIPFVKQEGQFIAYKSTNTEQEIDDAKYAIETLGCKIKSIEDMDLYEGQMPRRFVIIKKKMPTDKKYPRRSGMPQKKPLKKIKNK